MTQSDSLYKEILKRLDDIESWKDKAEYELNGIYNSLGSIKEEIEEHKKKKNHGDIFYSEKLSRLPFQIENLENKMDRICYAIIKLQKTLELD